MRILCTALSVAGFGVAVLMWTAGQAVEAELSMLVAIWLGVIGGGRAD